MANFKNKLTGADYLLILLYLNNKEPIKGAIRLTKMMFLFTKEVSEEFKKKNIDCDNLPKFYAYNFGPFSKDVYEQIELFKSLKFVKVTNINAHEEMVEVDDWEESPFIDEITEQDDGYINQDGKYLKYQLDTLGIRFVECELINNLKDGQKELLENFKSKITVSSPKQILKYVYTKYPEFTENSLIKDEVLGNE